jgi:NAD+ diphosphatase
MIGCHAQALTTDIHKDDEEMTEVQWFSRDEVVCALKGENPHLRVPGPIAIAHHLIKAWAEGEVRLL